MFAWTHADFFTDPDSGTPLPKNLIYDRGYRFFQVSAHDPTICEILPESFWKPAFIYPTKNLKVETVDSHLVYLIGMGSDSTSSGRLFMARVRFDRKALRKGDPDTVKHVRDAAFLIGTFLEPHGFDESADIYETISRN